MNPIFLPATTLALQSSPGGIWGALTGLAPLILIFVIFYVVLILPMMKQRKALQQVIENLKKGDRVVTTGGLYGEVVSLEGTTLILRIADNVRVKIAKSAVSGLESEGDKGSQSS